MEKGDTRQKTRRILKDVMTKAKLLQVRFQVFWRNGYERKIDFSMFKSFDR